MQIKETTIITSQQAQGLTILKKRYKTKLEAELRDNQMQGINFVIAKVMDELFDELKQEGV